MPIDFVDPSVGPQGSLPGSPIAGAFTNMLSAYGRRYPTAQEAAEAKLRNTQSDLNVAKLGAGDKLSTAVALSQKQMPPGSVNSDGTPMNHDQWIQSQLPAIVKGLSDADQIGQAGALFRTVMLNNPTGASLATKANAMQGAGDAYTSSEGGTRYKESADTARQIAVQRSANEGQKQLLEFKAAHGGMTDEQMNKQNEWNKLRAANPGASDQDITNMVYGGLASGVNQVNNAPYTFNKMDVLRGNAAVTPGGAPANGGQPAAGAPAAAVAEPVHLNDGDLNISMKDAVGVGPLTARLQNATVGGASTTPAVAEGRLQGMVGSLIQLDNMKTRMSGALSDTVKRQLPSATFEAENPATWAKLGLQSPEEDQALLTDKVNRELVARQAYAKVAADPTQSVEARKAASDFVNGIDRFAEEYLTPEALTRYKGGAPAPAGRAPSAQEQLSKTVEGFTPAASNQQNMKAATTVNTSIPPLTKSYSSRMKPGDQGIDTQGWVWEKAPDGSLQRIK